MLKIQSMFYICVYTCACMCLMFSLILIHLLLCDKDIRPVLLLLRIFIEQERQVTYDISMYFFF